MSTPVSTTERPKPVPARRRSSTPKLHSEHVVVQVLRRGLGPVVLILAVWWGAKAAFGLDDTILPAPGTTAVAGWDLITRGVLYDYIGQSLVRLLKAVALGIVIGVPCGLLLGSSRVLTMIFGPYLRFFQAISGIAWLPMVMLWYGLTDKTIEVIVIYTMFFPVIYNTMAGVRSVPRSQVDAVRVLGGGRLRLITDVWLMGSLPSTVLGVRLGIAYGWRALIAGEMVVGKGGVGYMLFQAISFHGTSQIIVGMITIGLLWTFIDRGYLRPLERATTERWGMVRQ